MTPDEYKAQRNAERAETYRQQVAKLRQLVKPAPAPDAAPTEPTEETQP